MMPPVLHGRVDRWAQPPDADAARPGHLDCRAHSRATGVSDPDMARALSERDHAMEQRASDRWPRRRDCGRAPLATALRSPADAPAKRERWLREVSTVAAYRDRWHIEVNAPSARHRIGRTTNRRPSARRRSRQGSGRERSATPAVDQPNNHALEPQVEISQGIELWGIPVVLPA